MAIVLFSNIFHSSCQGLADIIPKDSLLWKLKLLKSAASYANSRLHAVTAEVLVLARLNFFYHYSLLFRLASHLVSSIASSFLKKLL